METVSGPPLKHVVLWEGVQMEAHTGWASRAAQMLKNLPAVQETWVRFLSQEDPLEKGRATHSSILAWNTPWTEEPGGLQSMDHRIRHD